MRSRHCRRLGVALLVALASALPGCSGADADKVVHVRGTVVHNGKPLPLGMIVFEPDPSRGNRGPQGHADIRDGQFDTRRSQKGAAVGPQLVRITGGDGIHPEPFTPFGALLFDEHTVRIDLAKGQTELKFDVPVPKARPKVR